MTQLRHVWSRYLCVVKGHAWVWRDQLPGIGVYCRRCGAHSEDPVE